MTSARVGPDRHADVVVVGAGQSGLAVSHYLAQRCIGHVVLERGEVGEAWRRQRWDSLRLLTPNWLTRLPGFAYDGDDPDGFMGKDEVAEWVGRYATHLGAPVHTGADVSRVRPTDDGYLVESDAGTWHARAVVLASGGFNLPAVPAFASALPDAVHQRHTHDYHNPGDLRPGGVLVVGASASGLQLAEEILDAGHEVTISVGEHVRMPRRYRGRDIQYWMERVGLLDELWTDVDDIRRARGVPSPQLAGSDTHHALDLNRMTDRGARLVGRLAAIRGGEALFSGSLRNVCALADLKMNRLLDTIDEWVDEHGGDAEVPGAERFSPTRVPETPRLRLDLGSGEIRNVVWATGMRPDYSWLDVPVLDRKGMVRHDGGVAEAPGLYVLGLTFLRRRKSSFIHGAGDDARDLVTHLADDLDARARARRDRVVT